MFIHNYLDASPLCRLDGANSRKKAGIYGHDFADKSGHAERPKTEPPSPKKMAVPQGPG